MDRYDCSMHVQNLHPWNLTPKEAIALQRELAKQIDTTPDINPDSVSLIAGVDVSSTRFDPLLTAGVVVWEKETGRVVQTTAVQAPSEFQYIPGLLSFREIPIHGGQIGVVFRSKKNANPLFVSPGNHVSMLSAVAIMQECLRGYRLPEPTRLAHLHVNEVRIGGKISKY